jgi:uncharacterized protein YjbI with pentapeptide repeats
MSKIKDLYGKIVSTRSTEVVKTGAELVKALLDWAKALKENKSALPDLGEISSLLAVLNSPLAMVVKDTVPFAPLVLTILKQFQHELNLEECVTFIAQAAYLESWQAELTQQPDWLQKVDLHRESTTIAPKLKALGELEIRSAVKTSVLQSLPSSELVVKFNEILTARLEELGVSTAEAQRISLVVAQNAPRYLHQQIAESAKKVEVLAQLYNNGGVEAENFYSSIDEYVAAKIKPLPELAVFDEAELKLKNIFVQLDVQPLTQDGKPKQTAPISIGTWAINSLLNPTSHKILFVQGEAGRGKSAFCRMFAAYVQRQIPFTPILIRLRDLKTLENYFTKTLEAHLQNWSFTHKNDWLADKNQRFLFLLDGFDELLLEGRATGGLKEFLGQIEGFFNENCHHRCLITGRPLALQGLERSAFRSECLERVELMKMTSFQHDAWLNRWAVKFGQTERQTFEQFLQACPPDIYDRSQPQQANTNLVGEPLMLYLLARMHRAGAIQASELANTAGLQAKVKIYDRAVDWVLNRQRDNLNQQVFSPTALAKLPQLRQLMGEVAVCVRQSGNEMAKVSSIESRLPKDSSHPVRQLYAEMANTKQDGEARLMNAFLTAFYLQPAAGDREGSVEFTHKSFGEFLFAEHLKEAITDWSSSITSRKGTEDQIKQENLEWQIYDLLGYGCLTPEIVGYLWAILESSNDWQPLRLFQRLNGFWESWCEGEFIDKPLENLAQKKLRLLREQMPAHGETLGIRQVDVYTGLNVLILLLKLDRYARSRDDLKGEIIFYPSGQPKNNELTHRLLKVIHYSESIGLGTFNQNISSYFSGSDLRNANLQDVNLRGADLQNANLCGANLWGTNLCGANLCGANLCRADLSRTYLRNAHLHTADLRNSKLRGADLRGAGLKNADLSGADLSGAYLKGADLRDADLRRAVLTSASLSNTYLIRVNFRDANLSGVNFRGADLSEADLRNAPLKDADFSSANLRDIQVISGMTKTNWLAAKGLQAALNMPATLKQLLGLP